jgi:hypothetical protein
MDREESGTRFERTNEEWLDALRGPERDAAVADVGALA